MESILFLANYFMSMYLGRFLVVAPDYGVYRLSSRSFPDRVIRESEEGFAVVPEESYDNPYVSYNCLRRVAGGAVLGNGSHVDPIAEKIEMGYPPRDALALSLLAMDYEKDDYNTPRIAGVVGDESYIAIVTMDSLVVEGVSEPMLVATYEEQEPRPFDFEASGAEDAARQAYRLDYEHPVAACAVYGDELWVYNG